jgi:hypothetical protein
MRFTLDQYPAAIAQAAQSVSQIDQRIGEAKLQLDKIEGNADIVTAFDVNLKNDHQRKARRIEILQTSANHETYTNSLLRLTTDRANAVAMLEQLRNEFTVAKLVAQTAIADRMAGVDTFDLIATGGRNAQSKN